MTENVGVMNATDVRERFHRSVPAATWRLRALVDSMFLTRGCLGPAKTVANTLGFRNRFALARWLAREGAPSLRELGCWVSILLWLQDFERSRRSLCAIALCDGRDPAWCYRTVQRVTGRPWRAVRELGSEWLIERFRATKRSPITPSSPRG